MAIDLIQLVGKFKSNDDVETDEAFYKTKVHMVAPEAYLHTIYKGARPELIREVSAELELPDSIADFYRCCNGAHLFVNALSIFGCVASGEQISRSNRFKLPPFNVRDVNRELKAELARVNSIAIASYSYDGSLVCVNRQTEGIVCFFGESLSKERTRWHSIDSWLTRELQRMSVLFDESGTLLAEKQHLLPEIESSQVN
jgi:hypothetical protein